MSLHTNWLLYQSQAPLDPSNQINRLKNNLCIQKDINALWISYDQDAYVISKT